MAKDKAGKMGVSDVFNLLIAAAITVMVSSGWFYLTGSHEGEGIIATYFLASVIDVSLYGFVSAIAMMGMFILSHAGYLCFFIMVYGCY